MSEPRWLVLKSAANGDGTGGGEDHQQEKADLQGTEAADRHISGWGPQTSKPAAGKN